MQSGLENWMCTTCGVQFTESRPGNPPSCCPICVDERQYIGAEGQKWTTRQCLIQEGHSNPVKQLQDGLWQIGPTQPKVGIGQRALLVKTPDGNVLWDCLSHLDEETLQQIKALGGLKAIAISHPHFYDSCLDWAEAFNCQVIIHEADRQWLMRVDTHKRVRWFSGESTSVTSTATMHCLGGHFRGSSILHVQGKGPGSSFICTGDTIMVTPDKMCSFMWSYPNLLPLPSSEVERIVDRVKPLHFDKVFGIMPPMEIPENGSEVVQRSARRYIAALSGTYHHNDPQPVQKISRSDCMVG